MGDSFDTIVVGGGPGGYVAAIRAAQLGQKTAVVERDKAGGRCLNYACIPAKTMLRSAEIYAEAKGSAEFGVVADGVRLDWEALGKRRADVSAALSGGVEGLWKMNKIEFIHGDASLTPDGDVKVGEEVYPAKAVILATGSVALPIPGVEFGGRVLDTWGAWSLPEQPKKIAVVGGGASGSEIASGYARFGTEVILIEMLPQILPAEDRDIAKVVERVFKREGIEISTGTPVSGVEAGPDSVRLTYGDNSAEVDHLCIAGGRAPDTSGLDLEQAGIQLEENGKVKVDPYQRTSNPKVFAIGDLVNAKALAHKASEEGVVAAESAAGVETHPLPQGLVAGATFCHPQVASVGLTEEAARAAGHDVKVGKQKIAGEGGYQELARTVHPHPTVSEAVLDAARAVDGWAIHA